MSKSKGNTLGDFEAKHGMDKIRRLQAELEVERKKVATLSGTKLNVRVENIKEDTIRFALLGDTQFGSLYDMPGELQSFYKYAAERGFDRFYHTGDVLDGHRIYKGQDYEVRDLGWEAQATRFANVAPRHGKTYFITGNHDASFKHLVGMRVGEELSKFREDWIFLGETQASVKFKTRRGEYVLKLLHPGGGSAYSLSYKPQKIAEHRHTSGTIADNV